MLRPAEPFQKLLLIRVNRCDPVVYSQHLRHFPDVPEPDAESVCVPGLGNDIFLEGNLGFFLPFPAFLDHPFGKDRKYVLTGKEQIPFTALFNHGKLALCLYLYRIPHSFPFLSFPILYRTVDVS